jgi:hypothetical protein
MARHGCSVAQCHPGGTGLRAGHSDCMNSKELFNEATEIEAVDGNVELDGPDGVDVALTPEAAEETADRMFRASAMAAVQRTLNRKLAGDPYHRK